MNEKNIRLATGLQRKKQNTKENDVIGQKMNFLTMTKSLLIINLIKSDWFMRKLYF